MKLKNILGVSIPLFAIHGLEEYLTGFYDTDTSFQWLILLFESMTVAQSLFVLFQVMFLLLLIAVILTLSGEKWRKVILVLLGLPFIIEVSHLIESVLTLSYSSGLISGILLVFLGYYYWRSLIKNIYTKS